MTALIWLITGATSGLGKTLVSCIVNKGHRVVATGRQAEQRLADLRSDKVAVVDLDISASRGDIEIQVKQAWEAFGHIDILVNNAGLSAPKAIEEASDEYMRSLFDVNVFGPIRVTQAIIPLFRSQGHGSIAFIGAGVAWGPIAFLSHYSAAKAALDSFVEGLRKELRGQNIHSTIFEPGGFESRLGHPRSGSGEGFGKYQPVIPAYQDLFGEMMGTFVKDIIPNVPGDVLKMAAAIVDLVGSDGISGKLPIRLVLGSDAAAAIKQKCTEQLKLLSDFEDVSKRTDIDDTQGLTYDGTLKLMSMLN